MAEHWFHLPPNDVPKAVSYVEEHVKAGDWQKYQLEGLYRLQDDGGMELEAALLELDKKLNGRVF